MKLSHIGIAVPDLIRGQIFYKDLGLGEMSVEDVPSEKVKVGMFELDNDVRIELLEALDDASPIKKFMDKRGPGIHHICFEVEDIHKSLADLKEKNVQLINQEPVPGAHNCLVAFIHPKATGGVLIELNQPGAK